VLLTGATGFLGRELLWQLITTLPLDHDILCLVRGERPGAPPPLGAEERTLLAESRLRALLDEEAPLASGDPRRARVQALAGDITRPRLGLDEQTFASVESRLVEVYHGAATVRFDLPLAEARVTNVEGTREILALCRAAQRRGCLCRWRSPWSH
jgi:thioester reductase-like protein